ESSQNNVLFNNTIKNNWLNGIDLDESGKNILSYNSISNYQYGISLFYSNINSLSNNEVTDNGETGIHIYLSEQNTLDYNVVANNSNNGIRLVYSVRNTLVGNIISNNEESGISIYYASDYNIVTFNELSGNIAISSQAVDDGLNNRFTFNIWSDCATTDVNADGIVDNPYSINGSANNRDQYPLIFFNSSQSHFIYGPIVIFPNGELTLKGDVTVEWIAGIDSWGNPISYTVYYSIDGGITWIIITSGLKTTFYTWDTTTVDNTNCLIKITASSAEGIWNEDISDAPFTIVNPVPPTTDENIFLYIPNNITGGLIILVLVITGLILLRKDIFIR
ncbi:MAG: nitrous oxide reductase family maturation protein NosD, partial [Candidatus Hodarchaeota archaeon]